MNGPVRVLSLCVLVTAALAACSTNDKSNGGSAGSAPGGTAASAPSPTSQRITSESVVKVAVKGAEIAAGGFGDAIVAVTVQSGYHINSNPPSFPYLKATELEMEDTSEVSLNSIFYPKPLVRSFAFSKEPLNVYEGKTALTVSLEAVPDAKKGQQSIPAKLRIQACDDQVCYAPGSIDVVIPVLIK